eukprot:577171-Amphidinium_carterae.1
MGSGCLNRTPRVTAVVQSPVDMPCMDSLFPFLLPVCNPKADVKGPEAWHGMEVLGGMLHCHPLSPQF